MTHTRPMNTTTIRRSLTVAALAMVLVSGAVAPAAMAAPMAKKPTLIVRDLPAQVRLVPGETLSLVLSTNKTTGYSWSTKVSGDTSAVKVSAGVYTAPEANGMVGVPGTTTWTITAKATGKAVINVLATPPGGGEPTTQKLTVIVMKG